MKRSELNANKRRVRAEARAKTAALRASLREALALKRRRMRELLRIIHAERLALRDRLRAARRARLAELRDWEKAERLKAREDWKARREEARRETRSEIARVGAELAAEHAHAADIRRIEREARSRAAIHRRTTQSDDDVRTLIPLELVPLFERFGRSIRGTDKESRAEVFLKLAARRPDDVFKIVEPSLERMINDAIKLLADAERVEALPHALRRVRPANGNGLTAGGPNPQETARLAELAERQKKMVRGEGLTTAEVANAIRADIKAAVKSRDLPKAKYSVRTDTYSMGSSITVVASELPFPVLNPDAFRVEPGASWMTFDRAHHRSRFTDAAERVERKLEAIVEAYHWDRSDSMSDVYHERFARDVRITENKDEYKRIESAKLAAARLAEDRSST